MTLTSEHDLDSIKMNQQAKYQIKGQLTQNLLSGQVHEHTHTHLTICSTWTTKVVANNQFIARYFNCAATMHQQNVIMSAANSYLIASSSSTAQ